MQKLYYIGAAIVLLGIIGWVAFSNNPTVHRAPSSSSGLITPSAENAFGSFPAGSIQSRSSTVASPSIATALDSTSGGSGEIKSLPVNAVQYIYDGPGFEIPNLPVLRRDPVAAPSALTQSLTAANTGLLNLGSFSALRTDGITVTETTADGYTVNINYQWGTASLYKLSSTLVGKAMAVANTNTAPVETLSDADAVGIARAFVTDHGISIKNTGPPAVQNVNGAMAADTISSPPLFRSSLTTVIFPWAVDGTPVVDMSGNPYGLTVTIDAATRSVTGASNIADLHFTGSDYPLVTEAKQVLDVAKRGGIYGSAVATDAASITLSAPTPVYMIGAYQISDDGKDYLVPALMFTIGKVPNGIQLYQNAVVVPLVASLLTTPTPSVGSAEPATTTLPSATSGSGSVGSPTSR